MAAAGYNNIPANINAEDPYGYTQLHTAVRQLNLAKVRELIAAGANVNKKDFAGQTPLFFSLSFFIPTNEGYETRLQIIKELLAAGADPNTTNGWQPVLFYACEKNDVEVVKELLKAGADINTKVFKFSVIDRARMYQFSNRINDFLIDYEKKQYPEKQNAIRRGVSVERLMPTKTPLLNTRETSNTIQTIPVNFKPVQKLAASKANIKSIMDFAGIKKVKGGRRKTRKQKKSRKH